ncbi:Protoporphyrinogen IX dehydrogenase [menaquinone] [compost metagenome]
MRTLILYASKSGASREYAELLWARLADCAICDITKDLPDMEPYDTLILGSGIRMGKLYRPVRSFMRKNMSLLLSKNIAFYLCNAYPDSLQKAIETNIPKPLRDQAACISSFGGKPPFTSLKNLEWVRMDKVASFVKTITNSASKPPSI